MADIRITPSSSIIAFTSSLSFNETLTQDASGSIFLYGSGSTGRTNLFTINGNQGTLFSVNDDLSNTLFSVNTLAGIPVIEAFANSTVNIGKYGAYSFVATGSGNAMIGSGSVMFVSSSGNVGIGTTSPSSILSLYRGVGIASYLEISANGNVLGTTSMLYGQDASSNAYVWNRANAGVYFGTNNTTRMFLNSVGNLGINTTAPQKILDVAIGSNDFVTVGAMTSLSVGQWAGIHFGYRENNTNYRKSAIVFERTDNSGGGGNASGKVHILNGPGIGAGSATLADAKLTVNEYGNVGIGTTSPNAPLDVTSATSSTSAIQQWSYNSSPSTYRLQLNTIVSSGLVKYSFDMLNNSTAYDNVLVLTNGNVGIGTTSPAYKLDVNGTARFGASTYKVLTNSDAGGAGIKTIGGAGTHPELYMYNSGTSAIVQTYINNIARLEVTNTGVTVSGSLTSTSFTGSLQGSASYATTASYSLNAGSSATFYNNTNNYIMTGTGTTNTLNGESNLQYDGNGLFIGNAGSVPSSPTNGTVLYSEDIASSSELKVKDEAGNITTLSPHNFSLIPEGPSEPLAWSYYSENDGKKINVDMLKLARLLEQVTGEKLVYIE